MGTGVTKSLAAGKESEDLGTDKAGGRRCRQGRGYTDGEWGSGVGSLHRETRTGHPQPRALQINHIGPCVEKSFHRCSHFTSRTTKQTSQEARPLSPLPLPSAPLLSTSAGHRALLGPVSLISYPDAQRRRPSLTCSFSSPTFSWRSPSMFFQVISTSSTCSSVAFS